MNERLTIQDLTDLLAARHSMTKRDAEEFVREFFLLIEQTLESEKSIKIKGLGTFKLVDVDSRESVKVNTGERFRIKGHTKVSFSPDANLRDTINKPFAHFETVVLNENTILEDTPIEEETEEEETEEEAFVQASPEEFEEVVTETDTEEQPEVVEPIEEVKVVEPVEQAEEVEQVKQPEEEVTIDEQQPASMESVSMQPASMEEEKKEESTAGKMMEQELPETNPQPVTPIATKTVPVKEKSPVPYLIAVILVVLLLCGSVILFMYYPDLFSSSSDNNVSDMPPVTTQPVQPEAQLSDTVAHKDTAQVITPEVPQTVTPTQPVAPQKAATPVYQDSASYKITGTKTKYTIKEGETLTKVSMRFYGTKAMWPYIVKHNPKVIKNPDNVPYGTTIEIPELTKE